MAEPSPATTELPNYARLLGRMEIAAYIALVDLKYGDTEGAATVLAKALESVDDGTDAMETVAEARRCAEAIAVHVRQEDTASGARARGLAGVASLRAAAANAREIGVDDVLEAQRNAVG